MILNHNERRMSSILKEYRENITYLLLLLLQDPNLLLCAALNLEAQGKIFHLINFYPEILNFNN